MERFEIFFEKIEPSKERGESEKYDNERRERTVDFELFEKFRPKIRSKG